MLETTDLKNGSTFLWDGKPYKVLKYKHTKIGRGGAIVRVTVRDLISGSVEDKTFSSNVKVESVVATKKRLQFLYSDNKSAYFLEPETFEQVEISKEIVGEDLRYIKEGEGVSVLFWSDKGVAKPLSIEIPAKVELRVVETTPGIKGNSATNIFKLARLENGISIKIPLFVNSGDSVIVDTRNGEYVERAK